MRRLAGFAIAAAVWGGAAQAEITDRSAAGFEVTRRAVIAAPPEKVYAALMQPAQWWDSAHSWSGSASNLTLDPVGGCFCETLPKGRVRHLSVVFADGATHLRLEGALGPLQFTGASGHLAFALKAAGQGQTDLVLTYDVGGYAKGGLAETWAAPVDAMLGGTLGRLKRYLETGKPD